MPQVTVVFCRQKLEEPACKERSKIQGLKGFGGARGGSGLDWRGNGITYVGIYRRLSEQKGLGSERPMVKKNYFQGTNGVGNCLQGAVIPVCSLKTGKNTTGKLLLVSES